MPALSPIEREVFGWLVVLAVGVGLGLVGGHEAHVGGDETWAALFDALAMGQLLLYFHLVRWWVNYREV